MRLSSISFLLFRFFLPPSIIGLVYLYFYPFFGNCHFPLVRHPQAACLVPGKERPAVPAELSPFRLLTLADPQLEGDTSLPDPEAPIFTSLQRLGQGNNLEALRATFGGLLIQDISRLLQSYRKRLDLLGNDYYLAHIYRSVKWWTQPTHTVVLGDLLGSQWIDDDEFETRARRFWKRVFNGAEPVQREITALSNRHEVLGEDERWSKRVITVAGNHDIGYAGDIDSKRISRFEKRFGHVNWDIRFVMEDVKRNEQTLFTPPPAAIRLVILNSMNLDSPAYDDGLRQMSIDYMQQTLDRVSSSETATILLTHVPLHKEAGICVDAPMFQYFPPEQGGGISEQNHLSPEMSQDMLDRLGSPALILNGHDHEGCDTFHRRIDEGGSGQNWTAERFVKAHHLDQDASGIREITVRSMMGSFGGNAGLLSAWYDQENAKWNFRYNTCVAGVQHIWWAVHVLALIEIGLGLTGLVSLLLERRLVSYTQTSKDKTE